MKIVLFSIGMMLCFAVFSSMNEAQRGEWNRFWAIKPQAAQEETQVHQQQYQQQYTVIQQPISDDRLDRMAMNNLSMYKLQRKPLGGALGETEFEYMLRSR